MKAKTYSAFSQPDRSRTRDGTSGGVRAILIHGRAERPAGGPPFASLHGFHSGLPLAWE
jgi:hypothetical protein